MIEAGAKEVPEDKMIEAIFAAHELNQKVIAFSFVDATVSARSDTTFCAAVGLNTNSPSTSPTCVVEIGPSNGISESNHDRSRSKGSS